MRTPAQPRSRRFIVVGGILLLLVASVWWFWSPGLKIRDGRYDRGSNAIWVAHGWLGSDEWFFHYKKTNEFTKYRDLSSIHALVQRLRTHHIVTVYPHLCPSTPSGHLPPVESNQVERFLTELAGFRVIPWIGGPNPGAVDLSSSRWRATFCSEVTNLLAQHPRLAGVQLNIEPLPDGDPNFLLLLAEMRHALPPGKVLSIAAYPPPTRWHPYPEVHWSESYIRDIARHVDELAFMMYDTALESPRLYQQLMATWTEQALAWCPARHVLLGVPTYHDAGVGYHDPTVENLQNALLGVHRGLSRSSHRSNYVGIAVYSDWETDETEWQHLRTHFVKP